MGQYFQSNGFKCDADGIPRGIFLHFSTIAQCVKGPFLVQKLQKLEKLENDPFGF